MVGQHQLTRTIELTIKRPTVDAAATVRIEKVGQGPAIGLGGAHKLFQARNQIGGDRRQHRADTILDFSITLRDVLLPCWSVTTHARLRLFRE